MTDGCTYYYPMRRDGNYTPCGADKMIAVYWNRIITGAMPGELDVFIAIKWVILSVDLSILAVIIAIVTCTTTAVYLTKFFGIINL